MRSNAAAGGLGAERTWEVPNPGEPGFDAAKPKYYVLEMLPYPSGEPHVATSRTTRSATRSPTSAAAGFQVLHPMG